MKKGNAEVTSNNVPGHEGVKVVIQKLEFDVYETLAEATTALGEATCLELINTQNKTNLMNTARSQATGKPSKQALMDEAWKRITLEELTQAAGDPAKIRALTDRYVAAIEEELKAKRAAALSSGAAAEGAEEVEASA